MKRRRRHRHRHSTGADAPAEIREKTRRYSPQDGLSDDSDFEDSGLSTPMKGHCDRDPRRAATSIGAGCQVSASSDPRRKTSWECIQYSTRKQPSRCLGVWYLVRKPEIYEQGWAKIVLDGFLATKKVTVPQNEETTRSKATANSNAAR